MATGNELLIHRREGRILSVQTRNGKIVQIDAELEEREDILGNIYVGKVRNIVKNIGAAFVEFSKGQMGYLSLKNASPIHTDGVPYQEGRVLIGDEIMVQVVREAVKTKPPTLSGDLDLTGKYLVLTKGRSGLNVSSKIKDFEERNRLLSLLEPYQSDDYGWIARTNCATATKEQIQRECEQLSKEWQDICQYGIHKAQFTCLHRSPDGYLSYIRDGYEQNMDHIITDDDELYESIHHYLETYQPEDLEKLMLWDEEHGKMDAVYNISRTIEQALKKKVWLKTGGYLIVEPTEALVSIDVNTGKAISKKKDIQKTFLKVNKEAAVEIAKQLRLRNLSGMILVDFIDLKSEEDNKELMNYLKGQFMDDPLHPIVVDMTKLGLVEITRKKVRKSLYEQLHTEKMEEQ